MGHGGPEAALPSGEKASSYAEGAGWTEPWNAVRSPSPARSPGTLLRSLGHDGSLAPIYGRD